MSFPRWLLVLALSLAAGTAAADGGQVVLRQSAGDWIITMLAQPVPLRAGPTDLSVLVQDHDGAPILEAEVQLLLRAPDPSLHAPDSSLRAPDPSLHVPDPLSLHPDLDRTLRVPTDSTSANRLFREVRLDLTRAGTWQVEVEVTHSGARAVIDSELEVGEPLGDARRHWMAIALGPLGAVLIALHQVRASRMQKRSPSTGRPAVAS